jgi:hypothetical protein
MVPSSGSAPIDWVALRGWYLTSDEVLTIFDLCCVVARRSLGADAGANLGEAVRLSALTAEAAEWLTGHPCPHRSNGVWVTSIAQLFVVIASVIVATEGHVPAGNGALVGMVDDACDTVAEFRGLVVRVAHAPTP